MSYRLLKDKLFRLKTVGEDFLETQLKRCLSTIDITLLGVGHMMGAGIYVLTGPVVKDMAGPGVVLSFLFAGIASLLSALCYAEFGSWVPKAGSAYTYSYITVGEFWAFIIGWNIILEHMLGAAAVARSWSGYLDSLLSHAIKNSTISTVGTIRGGYLLSSYPDLVALLVVIAVAGFIGFGAKTSMNFNKVFTIVNMLVIAFVIICGFTQADFTLWTHENEHNGFMPFKFAGVLAGAGSCFFAFIGFDGIATAGEEASDPAKSIPIATFISMSVVTCCYILMSSALTLMVDYRDVSPTSAFSDAFERKGLLWAKYIVAIGAISGMTTSLVGSLFALPRCVYAMAKDGLLFRNLAVINPKTQVPSYAIMVFGSLTAVIALLFDIETLVEFLSIGTLLAYTIVSGSVIILRYKPTKFIESRTRLEPGKEAAARPTEDPRVTDDDQELLIAEDLAGHLKPSVRSRIPQLMRFVDRFEPGSLVAWSVLVMVITMLISGIIYTYAALRWYTIIICIWFALLSVCAFAVVCLHHQGKSELKFKVPLVPLVPALSILVNVILMIYLSWLTWIRLVVWLGIGLFIYFFYGIKHSAENIDDDMPRSTTYNTLVCTPGTESVNLPGSAGEKVTVTVDKPQPVNK